MKSFSKFIATLSVSLLAFAGCSTEPLEKLTTNFSYTTEEIASLSKMKSSETITLSNMYDWQDTIFELIAENKIVDVPASLIYAYFTAAQQDAAYLSYNAHGEFRGSLDAISSQIICQFFPDQCPEIQKPSDQYSQQLAQIVMQKVQSRIQQDTQMRTTYELKQGEQYWKGVAPYVGQDAGNRKTWGLKSGNQFRIEPFYEYNSAEHLAALEDAKMQLANATETQRQAVVYWAGGPGTKTGPGEWLHIASKYMKQNNTDLPTTLRSRALVSMTIADGLTAAFDSKWTHQVKRPVMMDPSIITTMPTPNHPSYPAGHGTVGGSAATILSHLFPENEAEWTRLGTECSISRTWGGIHYSIDNTAGYELGEKVAREFIAKESS